MHRRLSVRWNGKAISPFRCLPAYVSEVPANARGLAVMMPIPSHLVDCVVPRNSLVDEADLVADVRCPCGSTSFDLLFTGHTHEYPGEVIPCTAKIDDAFFFLIVARCNECSKRHLLLDRDFHGWDGVVCHDPKQAAIPRPPLVPWKCLTCGMTPHNASVLIQTQGEEDFIAETDGEFEKDMWPDAFGCFNMSINCVSCGNRTEEWVSCETM